MSAQPWHRIAVTVVLAALLVATGGRAVAQDPDARKRVVDGQISASERDLDLVSADLRTALSTLAGTDRRVAAARTALGKAEDDLRAANRHNNDIGGRLRVAQADETKNRTALTGNQRAQGRTRALVGGLARRAYMQGGTGRLEMTLDVITSDGGDVGDDLSLADIVLRQQNGVLRRLSGEQSAGKAAGDRLGGIRTRITSLKRLASAGVIRAQGARDRASRAKTSLEGLQRGQRRAADDLRRKKDKESADLRWLRGESVRLQQVLNARARARGSSPAAPPAAASRSDDGRFLSGPRPRSEISSPFGYRTHPVLGVRMLHAGSDFGLGCGQPVYAAAGGEIVSAGYNGIAGNNVLIDHGRVGTVDLATRYEHLSAFVVRSGSVAKGQLIGRVGTTGRSTGCHLHFAVLVNGSYTDPARWIG